MRRRYASCVRLTIPNSASDDDSDVAWSKSAFIICVVPNAPSPHDPLSLVLALVGVVVAVATWDSDIAAVAVGAGVFGVVIGWLLHEAWNGRPGASR
jgi:uncharacterized membrane protein